MGGKVWEAQQEEVTRRQYGQGGVLWGEAFCRCLTCNKKTTVKKRQQPVPGQQKRNRGGGGEGAAKEEYCLPGNCTSSENFNGKKKAAKELHEK